MNFFTYIRNRALNRALEQYLAERTPTKLPNSQRINSILVILEEGHKSMVKNIESSTKSLFGSSRCGFVILSNQMSDTILQSDMYNEITPKDFGFMNVLKPDKYEYIRKLPFSNMIINMASKHPDISDYICTLPKADFRVSFHPSDHIQIYDLVIENSPNADPVSNIHVLHNYLDALLGFQSTNS